MTTPFPRTPPAGRASDRPTASPESAVLAATGEAAWLCPTVVDHLARTAARYREQAGALGPGSF